MQLLRRRHFPAQKHLSLVKLNMPFFFFFVKLDKSMGGLQTNLMSFFFFFFVQEDQHGSGFGVSGTAYS